jgi:hypothetical protein
MSLSEKISKHKKLALLGSTAATIVAVSGALAVFGIQTPRPAWSSELVLVEAKILELDNIITSQQLNDITLRLYQNLREQNNYTRSGEEIPAFLLQEQPTLEIQKRMLEQRLDRIFEDSQ